MAGNGTRNGRWGWRRPAAAAAVAALLLLLALSFVLPAPPPGSPRAWARGAFLLLSTALSLAYLAGAARTGFPSGEGAETAPPAAVPPDGEPDPGLPDTAAELSERNRELLAHHRCTKAMMRARTAGGVFRVLLEGVREGLGYPGAVMAFLDNEGNLVFPPSPGEGDRPGFPGHTVPAGTTDSFFRPLLEADEPLFVDHLPPRGTEEYRAVAGDGKALVLPLFHRGWAGDHEGEGEAGVDDAAPPLFRPALLVLRTAPGGRELSPTAVASVLALLSEAEVALEMTDLYRRLRSLSATDGLTGLLNHREFYDRLTGETERARRYGHSISVLLLDVDDFKGYNDRFGHPAGDKVLRIIASLLRQSARGTDIVARYGGEEFAVILPESSSTGALLMAERIRTALASVNLSPSPDREVHLTASLGIFTSEAGEATVDAMVSMADDALYRAKKDGKNRVILRAGK